MHFFYLLLILAFFENINGSSKRLNISYRKDFTSFKKFTNSYEKNYKNSENLERGFTNFKKNVDLINSHNKNTTNTFSLRLNHFADEDPLHLKKNLFSFEIEKQNTTLILNNNKNDNRFTSSMNPYNKIPNTLDYRKKKCCYSC